MSKQGITSKRFLQIVKYSNWKDYQRALAEYRLAQKQYEGQLQAWERKFGNSDGKGNEEEFPEGCATSSGCLIWIVAVIAAFIVDASDVNMGRLGLSVVMIVGAGILHGKHKEQKSRRLKRSNPRPVFKRFEPEYIPPEEREHSNASTPPQESRHRQLSPMECLSILELASINVPVADIKAAYRRKMMEYHPDKVAHLGADLRALAHQKAKQINAAYEVLMKIAQTRQT